MPKGNSCGAVRISPHQDVHPGTHGNPAHTCTKRHQRSQIDGGLKSTGESYYGVRVRLEEKIRVYHGKES